MDVKHPIPEATLTIPWPHEKLPPNYQRAVDYIISQVLDIRRGTVDYDFTNQRYTFYLPIAGSDIYLHPCLAGHDDIWLIMRQPIVEPIDFCYGGNGWD